MMNQQLRSVDETVPTLRISRATIWRHLKRGSIRSVRIGRKLFISESEISRILRDGIPPVSNWSSANPKERDK